MGYTREDESKGGCGHSVINWMLETKDVEDVACTVDDMEALGRWRSLVQRGLSEGREGGTSGQEYKGRNDGHLAARGSEDSHAIRHRATTSTTRTVEPRPFQHPRSDFWCNSHLAWRRSARYQGIYSITHPRVTKGPVSMGLAICKAMRGRGQIHLHSMGGAYYGIFS